MNTDGEISTIECVWGHLGCLDKDAFHRAVNYITARYEDQWAKAQAQAVKAPELTKEG